MTVKAEYRGMTFEFPDGTPDDQIYSQIQQKFEEGNKDYGAQAEPAWYEGFSKVPEAIGEGWSSMLDATMAANVGPSREQEAIRQFELQEDRTSSIDEQMGIAPQIASGIGRYGPAVAAGIASLPAGGFVGGTMSSADALREQYRTNKEFDGDRAMLAGAATGLTDMATGGLGRFIAKPGAGLASRAFQQAKTIAAEDMTSAAASKVYENWAARKDLGEGVGEAALMGGAAGGAVRGGIHAGGKGVEAAKNRFSGAAAEMGIPPNTGSESSIKDVTELDMGPGPSPNEKYADDYINFATVAKNARDDIANSVDEADVTSRVQGLNKILEDGAHLDATARFGKALQSDKAHIIDSIFDANIPMENGGVWNIGKDGLNLDEAAMLKSREDLIQSKGHNIPFMSRVGEAQEGLTAQAFNEKSQKFGRDVRKKMQGSMNRNLTFMSENARLANMEGSGASAQEKALWKEAIDSYTALHDSAVSYNKESDGTDTTYTAKVMANRFNDAITRLGRADEILDINGSKGNLNPLADFKAFTAITEGFRQQNKQFSQGKPDALKEVKDVGVNIGYGLGVVGAGMINPALGAAVAAKKVADEAYKLRGRHKAGGRVQEAKGRVSQLTPEVTMFDKSLEGGDGPGAAAAAAVDLEAQGIKTGQEPVQPAPVQQPVPEAPVAPVESVQQFRKADARVRPAPAPKAVQEPVVEATPVEAPKPNAKAAAKPQKSKNELRKEREATRKAEAQARKEAKQAAIAAQLQADIQAGAKRGEPLGRTAPAKKVEEVVEAPVEAPDVVEPKAKPEAKAKAKPAQKAKEEPTVEESTPVTPEPIVESAPTPKPDAKSRTKPEPKKVEEPAQEAPPVKEREPLGRKAPQRKAKEEEAPESVTEAPVKEAEVEVTPEPKAIPAAKLVREPLKRVADEQWPVGRRKEDPTGYREHLLAKEELKTVDNIMRTHDKYTPEEIAQVIEDTGGAKAFLAEAKDSGKTPDAFLGLRMRELERLRQKEGAAKTSEMKAILKEQKASETKPDTTAAIKEEKTALDRKEFDDEMDALGYHPDDVAQVSKSIEEKGYSLKNARKEASRLNSERKARMRKDMNDDAATLKEANTTLDLQGRKAQVDEYVSGLKVEGDDIIQGMIDTVFKHNDTKVTPKEVQNLLNKVDNHLAAEKKRYSAIDKADPRAPEYEAKAAAYRAAQNTLKSNRRNVDRVYSKANKDAQEATEALTKREKDFDALFRQANERDANVVQVRNQKDELFDKLTGQGFDELDVRKYIGSTFFEREGIPLTELGKKHVIEKFIDQQANARKDSIAKKAKAVKSIVKETDDGTVIQMTSDLMESVEFDPKMSSADELLAMTQALHDEAASRGLTKEADRLKLFNEGIIEGKVNKIKYPDNPELWVPYEVKTGIQGTFGNAGSAYAGNLLKKINAAVTGDADGVKGFMTKPRNSMKTAAASAEGKMKGKLATGDDDIVMK
ncbi:MAG: hypothetical protein ACRC6V_14355 [Bacteroidales bacterium]